MTKKATTTPLSAPKDLGSTGKDLWTKLAGAYRIDDEHGSTVLALACRAADREQACRKQIERDGVSVRDKWNQIKPHPLLAAERDARSQLLAALRALSLPIPEA